MILVCKSMKRKGRKGSSRKGHGRKTKGDCRTKPRKYGKACGCKTVDGGFTFLPKRRCGKKGKKR